MSQIHVPPPLVDPETLPPPILTSEPGSFAHHTLRVRVPGILRDTIAANEFPAEVLKRLFALRTELVAGVIRGLQERTPDRGVWDVLSAPYLGRAWLDVPWYWAEAYFYRRLLEATGYFLPGPWQGFDPFASTKAAEWAPSAAPAAVEGLLAGLPDEPWLRFERLFHASLWGNRTDLSYTVAAHMGAGNSASSEQQYLLVDHTPQVWAFLQQHEGEAIAVICDNAGTELLMDLALVDFLLGSGLARSVRLHLKAQPTFVSDAMLKDVRDGLAALPGGGQQAAALQARLLEHLRSERLELTHHWFYTSSLFYFRLPADLQEDLDRAALVLVKGDANYRRLLGDAHWPPATPFAEATAYFPVPFVALRTLKSELIAGLQPGQAEALTAQDPGWLVNGKRGVIQSRLPL